jgi:hypothetical protein
MHLAVLGLLCLIAAFYTFSCTLVVHAANRTGCALPIFAISRRS